MQAPLQATGNFGDLRDGRFHAGIDYSTFGKVGRPVYAVDDGWVWRVRASGQGYGRSIYLQLKDGRFAVYGHLSRYAPKIDAYVWQRQDSSGEYEQDLQPPAGALAFTRGEVIGWRGASGDGPPHLHFEIRRGDMNLHPFLFGYVHPDKRAPSIVSVRVTPVAWNSRVAGAHEPVIVRLEEDRVTDGPEVPGPFTISVNTGDWADGRQTRKATYALRAWIDGSLAYEAVLDSFSWDDMPEAEFVYDLTVRRPIADDLRPLNAPTSLKSGIVHRAQPFFDLSPGVHILEIEAVDESENLTRRSLRLTALQKPTTEPARVTEPTSSIAVRSAAGIEDHVILYPQDRAVRVPGFHKASRAPFVVEFDSNSFFAIARIRLAWLSEIPEVPRSLADGLTFEVGDSILAQGRAMDLSPSSQVVRRAYRVGLEPHSELSDSAGIRGRGLYLFRNGDWSFLSSDRDSLGRFTATTRRLGTFAVLADTIAPTITPLAKKPYAAKATAPPPPLAARVTDSGSGIAIRDASIKIDGKKVPAEFSQEEKTLTWRPRKSLAKGKHFAQIEAKDRAGNRSSVVVPFEVR